MCAVRFKNSPLQNWRKRVLEGKEMTSSSVKNLLTWMSVCLSIYLYAYPSYHFTYLLIYQEREMESSRGDNSRDFEVTCV